MRVRSCTVPAHALGLAPGIAAALHSSVNLRYLTGFTGEGALFVSCRRCVLVTDVRYIRQAAWQVPGMELVLAAPDHAQQQQLAALCRAEDVDTLLVEPDLPVDRYAALSTFLGDTALRPLGRTLQRLRQVKSPEEQERLRDAGHITVRAFEGLLRYIRPGMTPLALRRKAGELLFAAGADALAFPPLILAGPDSCFAHGEPTERPLQTGDMVTIDLGAVRDGYCADMTRTVAVGPVSARLKAAHGAVLATLEQCRQALREGVRCAALAERARETLAALGFSAHEGHALGHGVGLSVHEAPQISSVSRDTLVAGMAVALEPGVFLPGLGGARVEDTYLLQATGAECVTDAPRELTLLSDLNPSDRV